MYAQTAQRPEAAPQPVGGDEWTAGVLQNTHALRQEVPEPLETAGKWRKLEDSVKILTSPFNISIKVCQEAEYEGESLFWRLLPHMM